MMPGELLDQAHRLGGRIYRRGETLHLRPAHVFTSELVAKIEANKPQLLRMVGEAASLDPEVQWRSRVMSQQVPPSGAIPLLTARRGHWPLEECRCWTCGDFVVDRESDRGQPVRCPQCVEAAWAAVRLVRGIGGTGVQ